MVAGTCRLLVLLAVIRVWRAVNILLRLHLLQLAFVYFFHLNRHNLQYHDYFGSILIRCLFYYFVSPS